MQEQQQLQIVRDAYAAFGRGDIESVLNALTDDIVWEAPGPSQIPFAGVFHGKDGVSEFFQALAESDDIEVFEPQRFFANGDMVVVLGRYAARIRASGNLAETQWAHAFTFRGDKVAKYAQYVDTAKLASAYAAAGVLT